MAPKRKRSAERASKASQALGMFPSQQELPLSSTIVQQNEANDHTVDESVTPPKSNSRMKRLLRQGPRGLAMELPTLASIDDIFRDLTKRALVLKIADTAQKLAHRPVRIATMCSGTESPLLAIEMIQNTMREQCVTPFEFEHVFSVEITPYKQAYIERNFQPKIIFSDVVEVAKAVMTMEVPLAKTAYGATAEVPLDIDILIFGSSCKDFSKLNTKRTGLEKDGKGESSITFYNAVKYISQSTPTIILLENVLYAPWDEMLSTIEDEGYASAGVLVDTKDYYLPQTRQRGYAICIRNHPTTDAAQACQQWTGLMANLKRQASSSLTEFLLPSAQVELDREIVDAASSEWVKCEKKHRIAREKENLGTARPITEWQESGYLRVPEFSDQAWLRRQVDRVKDLIEIVALRKASRHVDIRYKTECFDLSQNVDRTSSAASGICPCLTPTGMYYLTDAGRLLSAEEMLKLQGLPVTRLILSNESARELADLAGNAMSTTVIGASILAALISGCDALYTQLCERKQSLSTSGIAAHTFEHGCLLLQPHAFSKPMPTAALPLRSCVCEASWHSTCTTVLQCKDCFHKACFECAGNPVHNYAPLSISTGLDTLSFRQALLEALPSRVEFAPVSMHSAFDTVAYEHMLGIRFTLVDVQRRRTAIVCTYTAAIARLELALTPGHFQWALLASHPSDEVSKASARYSTTRPVAESHKVTQLMPTKWFWCQPHQIRTKLDIRAIGEPTPSWLQRYKLPNFGNDRISVCLQVDVDSSADYHDSLQDILGIYDYLEHCETAEGYLYKRRGPLPTFLFKDPSKTGPDEDDRFVFAPNAERRDHGEQRNALGVLESDWIPSEQCTSFANPVVLTDGWLPMSADLVICKTEGSVQMSRNLVNKHCAHPKVVMECSSTLDMDLNSVSIIDRRVHGHLQQVSHLVNLMRPHFHKATTRMWQSLPAPPGDTCRSCAPEIPIEHDDGSAFAEYERLIKARPPKIMFTVEDNKACLALNIQSIIHQACALLPSHATDVAWRLCNSMTGDHYRPPHFRLTPTRGVTTVHTINGMSCNLFPQQSIVLQWMLAQECGVDFVLEETAQEVLGEIGWVLEGRASCTRKVKGGICAAPPGFGKTVLTLAIIASTQQPMDEQSPSLELDISRQKLLAIGATLIICPPTLVRQWRSEITSKLQSYAAHLIVISQPTELDRYNFQQFNAARIVLVSRKILGDDSYVARLARFTGIRRSTSFRSPKHFETWLGQACERIAESRPPQLKGSPVLEAFSYERIVVDEFHDLGELERVAVVNLTSSSRWGLSATPCVDDFRDISQMADLISLPLRFGPLSPATLRIKTIRKLKKDMTRTEYFNMLRQPKSHSDHARRHRLLQSFCDNFIRQDIMDFSKLPLEEHYVPVSLDVDHSRYYANLSTEYRKQEMHFRAKTDRSRVDDDPVECESAEEVLSRLACSHRGQGAKVQAAVTLLRQNNARTVLFVQYKAELEVIEAALKAAGVKAIVVKGGAKKESAQASEQIAQFQAGSPSVIVLNMSDEVAAGHNLQMANHVVFLSPLLRTTQYSYEATMAQAIGRLRRHGQKQTIHVHRLVALDTIDVDILEHREKRRPALGPCVIQNGTQSEVHLTSRGVSQTLKRSAQLIKVGDAFLLQRNPRSIPGPYSSLAKLSRGFVEDDEE